MTESNTQQAETPMPPTIRDVLGRFATDRRHGAPRRRAPAFATSVEETPVHQARRQFLANQFARSASDARPAATDGSPPAPGRLARFTFAAGRLLLGVAALTFFAWALLDAWTLPIVEHSWPSGRCVAVEPDPWTCEQLPPRYTTTWVSPEAGR